MSKYELKIDINVLNHLGLNLYSNVPAVLSELIANAWDADSTEVNISTSNDEIKIEDNGCGMTSGELNDKFLNVGYQRRDSDDKDLTPQLHRKVMGRKGIGKLSIFSIAKNIDVFTKKEDVISGISLQIDGIKEAIKEKESYHPEERTDGSIEFDSGTSIILKDLKKRMRSSLDHNLKKRVARRFSIWNSNFTVTINNELVSIKDGGYFDLVEFAILYGDYPKENFRHIDDNKLITRPSPLTGDKNIDEISGWIGLVRESNKLQDGPDNLNKIPVLCRGKLALEDILEMYRDGGLYTKFLIGEIRADFLDTTREEDIATTSRQNFIQDDERFIKIKDFIGQELKFIKRERAKYKTQEGTEKAQEIPAIKDWFSGLPGDAKNAARKLFGRINEIEINEEHRKTLYKHGVLAFEHLHYKDKLQQLEKLNIENLEETVRLFSELDDIEATWYYEITQGRLDIINKLIKDVDENALESIIQQHIYNHLWLLDPSWDRATEPARLEETVKKAFAAISDGLSESEKKGRIDIRYKKAAGKHIIIELKRSSVSVKQGQLTDQIKRYKSALRKQLSRHGEREAIECICLLGQPPQGWNTSEEKQEGERALAAEDIRVITYEQLITDAQARYQAYLDKKTERGRISQLLQEIDKQ